MLKGKKVTLRAIEREDVALLAAWAQDHDMWPQVNYRPYEPQTVADALRDFDAPDSTRWRPRAEGMPFAIVVGEELVGSVALWGIDQHNRRAHLGISLGPDFHGKGYGSDACRVILSYAFVDRGLHRVQLEVLASNEQAIRAYVAAGFVEEGRTRESAWVTGEMVDEVFMSVLATEWQPT